MAWCLLVVTSMACDADRFTLLQEVPDLKAPSGIRGSCKVQHNPGTAPLPGWTASPPVLEGGVTVTVRDRRNQRTIAEVESGKDGEFCIHLAPGIYQVQASKGPFSRSSAAQSIEVRACEFTEVMLEISMDHP